MKNPQDFEVKTALSEADYKAMHDLMQAKGLTQAGYIRNVILKDICHSQDVVFQMNAIRERAMAGPKSACIGRKTAS